MVGNIDSARSQYVLRRTLFGAATTTCSADCVGRVQRDCGSMRTGSSSDAMVFPFCGRESPLSGAFRLAEIPQVSMGIGARCYDFENGWVAERLKAPVL